MLLTAAPSSCVHARRRRDAPARRSQQRPDGLVHVGDRRPRSTRRPSGAAVRPSSPRQDPGLGAGRRHRLILLGGAAVRRPAGHHRRARAEPAVTTEVAERVADRVAGGDLGHVDRRPARGRGRPARRGVQPHDRRAAPQHVGAGAEPRGPARQPRTHRRHVDEHPRHGRPAPGRARDRGRHAAGPGRRRAVRCARRAAPGRRSTGCTRRGSVRRAASRLGAGVLGHVVASGESVRGRLGSGPAELEPGRRPSPARATSSRRRCAAWATSSASLALYGREDGRPFDADRRRTPCAPLPARPARRSTTCSCTRRPSGCRPPTG